MSYLKLSFAKKKVVINKMKILAILGFLLMFLPFDVWWFLSRPLDFKQWATTTPLSFVFLLPILILVVWGIYKVENWIEKKIDAKIDIYVRNWKVAEKGDKGEELVYKELYKLLNSEQSIIYRNLTLPSMTSDMDIVVVGLKGVILFEVKNKDTVDSYTATKSFYMSRWNRLIKKYLDLRDIVKWRAVQLEKYLAEKGVDNIKVRKVILYVNPHSVEIQEYGDNKNHVYIVQGLDKLKVYLATSRADEDFTLELFSKVKSILTKLK